MEDIKRYLGFFGVGDNVSERELKAIRNVYLKRYHPDSGRPDCEEMAKMTNIAYEKISAFIRARDRGVLPPQAPPGAPGRDGRPKNRYYRERAGEYLRKRSRRQGPGLIAPGHEDIYGDAMSLACKKYFVDAVLNYTYHKSIARDLSFTCGWYLNVFPLRVLAAWVGEVYPDWEGNRRIIREAIKGEDYRRLFVSAVNEYAREKHCTIKEALLAFRIPPSKYYYWKGSADEGLLQP